MSQKLRIALKKVWLCRLRTKVYAAASFAAMTGNIQKTKDQIILDARAK